MPPTLHPHLKRGFAFDDFEVHPDDIIEHPPPASLGPEEQSAKRLRVERIAAQYLQGKTPVLLTAGLRGPFNAGWKNPWAQAKEPKRRSLEKANNAVDAKGKSRRTSASQKAEPSKAKRQTRSGSRRTLQVQAKVASPEESRAATYDMEDINESHTLEDLEVPPATAPSPNENDISGATEFYSVDTGSPVTSRSPLTNPFWLRRTESAERLNMKRSTNDNTYSSPTKPRSGREQADAKQPLQLAVPKIPLCCHVPARATRSDDIMSSASAPMIISSPMKPEVSDNNTANPSPVRANATPAAADVHTRKLVSETQPAQANRENSAEAATPATALRYPSANAGSTSAPSASASTVAIHESMSKQASRKKAKDMGVQGSAEHLVDLPPGQNSPASQLRHGSRRIDKPALASGACSDPNSVKTVSQQKVEAKKWTIGNAPRSKPRAVNFNSSPVVKLAKTASKPSSQHADAVTTADLIQSPKHSDNGQSSGSQLNEPVQEQQSLRSRRSSRQSAMSTQAAMLLAQLEFQESTYPTSSSRTSRPWSQSQSQETPGQPMPEPSPSITPLSVFRPALEQAHHLASAPRGPPMSTQDLFAAASPFAFSTVKKKPEPQLSNLRISMMPLNGQSGRSPNASSRSPDAFVERTPLQGKDVAPSPWSFSFGQGLTSQSALKGNITSHSFHDVDVSLAPSQTSLDDRNHLHFAERLLRNLDT